MNNKIYKKGEKTAVCYDGKWGRAVAGTVTKISPQKNKKGTNKWIEVKFIPFAQDSGEQKVRFTISRCGDYAGYLKGDGEWGIIRALGGPGDFYSCIKIERLAQEYPELAEGLK